MTFYLCSPIYIPPEAYCGSDNWRELQPKSEKLALDGPFGTC